MHHNHSADHNKPGLGVTTPATRPVVAGVYEGLLQGIDRVHLLANRLESMHARIYGPTPAEVEKDPPKPSCAAVALPMACDTLHTKISRVEAIIDSLEQFV